MCACSVCGGKDQPASQILCDDCDQAFHIWCLSPPLKQVPEEDEWLVVYSREKEREGTGDVELDCVCVCVCCCCCCCCCVGIVQIVCVCVCVMYRVYLKYVKIEVYC